MNHTEPYPPCLNGAKDRQVAVNPSGSTPGVLEPAPQAHQMPHDTHGHMPCPHEHQKYQMFMISSVSSVGLIAVQGTVCLSSWHCGSLSANFRVRFAPNGPGVIVPVMGSAFWALAAPRLHARAYF